MWIVRLALNRPYTFVVLALLILGIGPITIAAHADRHLPQHQHPGRRRPLELRRPVGRGHGRSDHLELRALADDRRSTTSSTSNRSRCAGSRWSRSSCSRARRPISPSRRPPPSPRRCCVRRRSAPCRRSSSPTTPRACRSSSSRSRGRACPSSSCSTSASTSSGRSSRPFRARRSRIRTAASSRRSGRSRSGGAAGAPPRARRRGQRDRAAEPHPAVAARRRSASIEYDVDLNASPRTVNELNDLPIKMAGGTPIYIRDVAHVRNGYPPQTNIARVDGQRAALMVGPEGRQRLDARGHQRGQGRGRPGAAGAAARASQVKPLADQSVFVRASIEGVLREAIIAACLTALMILVFLGSWRSTLIIAVSIPLSVLSSIIALSALGETINIMTLGGLALAVGILVDDATVAIENINWHLEQGKPLEPAILDGSHQIAIPAFVSTICICIVFVPMFFLTGVARYLFVPMAEAVVFAMLASYVLSRTLVPTMAKYLLKPHAHAPDGARSRNPLRAAAAGDRRRLRPPARRLPRHCSSRRSIRANCSRSASSARASPRSCSSGGSARTSFRRSTAASSSCTCARRPARASRRQRRCAIASRRRSASLIPRERNRQRHRQHRPALQRHQPLVHATRRRSARRTPTSW